MRADFYILSNPADSARGSTLCRLLEKAYKHHHKVFVQCTDRKEAEWLDELLWTYNPDSFIPHNIQGEGPNPPPPIQMGYDKTPAGFNDILINLAPDVPSFFQQFKRIIEVIPAHETAKTIAREHYRFYKTNQVSIETHHL